MDVSLIDSPKTKLPCLRLGFGHSRIRERSPNVEFECCSKSSILCLTLDFIRMFESPHSKVEYSKPNVRECRIRMLKKSDFWIRITTLKELLRIISKPGAIGQSETPKCTNGLVCTAVVSGTHLDRRPPSRVVDFLCS